MFRVQVLQAAENDARAIAEYYDSQAPLLGDVFLDEFEVTLRRLPVFWASEIKYSTVRKRHFSRFPYSVHYRVDEDRKMIIVEAVLHDRKEPKP